MICFRLIILKRKYLFPRTIYTSPFITFLYYNTVFIQTITINFLKSSGNFFASAEIHHTFHPVLAINNHAVAGDYEAAVRSGGNFA